MTAAEIAAVLGKARREGREWRCLCPAHDDHNPSLSLTERDGKLLVTCRAGCDQNAVLDSLRQRGLWPRHDRSNGHARQNGQARSNITAVYDYVDESGKLLFQVCRTAAKNFPQRRPGANGDWIWNLDGTRRVPYHLPELLAAAASANGAPWRVYIVEGEKDADRARQWGLVATTNPGGASETTGKWRPEYNPFFRGAEAVVIPDNDTAGRTHAQDVARNLAPVAASVRILELGGLPEHGDFSDWADAGANQSDLETLVELAPPYRLNGAGEEADATWWGDPDMEILRLHRRVPPDLPIDLLGDWGQWIAETAFGAACPADYVAVPLFAAASALIGHARWAQATPGWAEPPHLWFGCVGDSGTGKSPGGDALHRDVLPTIEQRMLVDFPDQLKLWRARQEIAKAAEEKWKSEVRDAHKKGAPPPMPPEMTGGPEPQAPRLRQHDVTIERVATLLATAAPKGLLIVRDELAGWIDGMNAYNTAGRSFWVEAYGGRPFRVERQKHPEPICVPRLAVSVYGGTQPEKLAMLMRETDDGLLARFLWSWPAPIAFRLGNKAPRAQWAIEALDRLRQLDLQPGDPPQPIMIPLTGDARELMEKFGGAMQDWQSTAGGLLRSALGKARGHALRLALVLEMLWWCGSRDGMAPPPSAISLRAFSVATMLIGQYFVPMAERVFGDAAATVQDRNAATLARWITRTRSSEVYVRHLQRKERLPGLKTADDIHEAAAVLVEADWLQAPTPSRLYGPGRVRVAYRVNPRVWDLAQ